jgi:hypothetical protein
MTLRASQLETLRLAEQLHPGEIEVDFVAEQKAQGFQEAWAEMRALERQGYLKDSRLAGYRLTQQGHQALAEGGGE